MSRVARGVSWSVVLLLALVLVSGCSGDKKFKITGKVSIKSTGQMLTGATVFFRPQKNPDQFTSRGYVGADGTYSLSTVIADDGVPAGTYNVMVSIQAPSPEGKSRGAQSSSPIDRKYASFETSGLVFEVKPSGPFQFDMQLEPGPG